MSPHPFANPNILLRRQDQGQNQNQSIKERLTPTHDQKITLIIIASYTVAILILWNVKYLRELLKPFKVRNKVYRLLSHGHICIPNNINYAYLRLFSW